LKLDIPLVANKPNPALTQSVQAADFASGISQTVRMRQWNFINPEFTIPFLADASGAVDPCTCVDCLHSPASRSHGIAVIYEQSIMLEQWLVLLV
jgi:hypothetical protein